MRNPEAEQQRETAEARIEELALENAALRGQLQQLEAAQQQLQQGQSEGGAEEEHGVAAAVAEAEIAILKRKVQ